MSENEIQEEAVEAATDTQAETTEEVKAEETAAPVEAAAEEVVAETEEVKAEATAETTEEVKTEEVKAEATEEVKAEAAPAEPEEEEEPEEISYHAVEKEGEITSIWEMQGRKHIRTISARSGEGTKILSLFTSEIHETDSPAMGSTAEKAA